MMLKKKTQWKECITFISVDVLAKTKTYVKWKKIMVFYNSILQFLHYFYIKVISIKGTFWIHSSTSWLLLQ